MDNPYTVLGVDVFSSQEVRVSDLRRQFGLYTLGVQGMGKSSFLENLIYQDIVKNYAVIVIDPHYDLIRRVVAQMPDEAVKRTYLLDLEDYEYPFALNIFALRGSEAQDIKYRQMAIDRIVRVCEKLFPGESRMYLELILRVIVHTLIDNPGTSMGDIPSLLNDASYRTQLLKNISRFGRRAREYWELTFNSMSPSKRVGVVSPLVNRVTTLLASPIFENIVCQKTSSIDFRRSIERKEIVLISLPVKEYPDVAEHIGKMLVAEIYRATFSFRDMDIKDRPGFSLFVDEFQNFSTKDFAELFTEGRKFGVRMSLAHQERYQVEEFNKFSTLSADTTVAFRLINYDARELSSKFVSQNANIREKVVLPDILKHLPGHASERVQSFLRWHIQPLQARIKEPAVYLPSYLPQFQTNADVLRFLERLMYLVQVEGRLFAKEGEEKTLGGDMYLDYTEIASYMLGFSNYILNHVYNRNPKKKAVEDKAQKQLSQLTQSLEEKEKHVESTEAFLEFFDRPSRNNEKWHQEDASLESRRLNLQWHLRSFLLLGDYDLKGESPLPTVFSWQNSGEANWYELDAEYNKLLVPYARVDNLLALRRVQMEKLLARLTLDVKNYRSELVRVDRQKTRPFQKAQTYMPMYNRGHELERLIEMYEKRVATLEKCLAENRIDTGDYKAEEIASVCAHFAALDTPDKVIERKKELYIKSEINPLREQVASMQDRLKTDLEKLEQEMEAEKAIHDDFVKRLWICLHDLWNNPICEQKSLTASDTAQILEHIDARRALVRTGSGVYLMQTLDTPSLVEADVLSMRMDDIRTRSRSAYCRPRSEVEAELDADREVLSEDTGQEISDTDNMEDDIMRFDDDD